MQHNGLRNDYCNSQNYSFFTTQMDLSSCAKLLKSKEFSKWFVPFMLRALTMTIFAVTFLVLRVQLNKGSPNFSK